MRRRILLTGPPGCGKTTVAGKVADILCNGASGFYTEEIRDAKKQRIGFRVVTLDGKRGELADRFSVHGPRVGSYRVNVASAPRGLTSASILAGGRIRPHTAVCACIVSDL